MILVSIPSLLQTFSVVDYVHWRAVVVLVLNFVGTFFWNFNHLFVMLISMPLSYRFRQVNEKLESVSHKVGNSARNGSSKSRLDYFDRPKLDVDSTYRFDEPFLAGNETKGKLCRRLNEQSSH